jgi:tight adherence protein B
MPGVHRCTGIVRGAGGVAAVSGVRVDLVVVLDVSGSLGAPEVLADSVAAVNDLLNSLAPDAATAVVVVGGQARVIAGWDAGRDGARLALQQVDVGGASPLHDGVVLATQLLGERPAVADHIVVIVADGDDSSSSATLDETLAALGNLEVWAVEVPTRDTNRDRLQALVGDRGGKVVALDDVAARTQLEQRLQPTVTVPITTVPATTATTATVPVTTVPVPATNGGGPVGLLVGGGASLFLGVSLAMALVWSRQGTGSGVTTMAARLSAGAERLLALSGRRLRLSAMLDAAGVALRPGEVIMATLTFALSIGLVLGAVWSAALGVVASLGVVLAVAAALDMRVKRRRRAFAAQLPDLLGSISSALRAGYALSQALDAVARNAESPGREELSRVVTEIRLGRSPSDALAGVAGRTASRDFTWAVTAMEIHRDVGGDLGVILDTVAQTARERLHVAREVHALTAEGRVSAAVLTALPPLLVLALVTLSPGYLEPLSDGPGPALLAVAVLMLALGWWWMRRLVRSGVRV